MGTFDLELLKVIQGHFVDISFYFFCSYEVIVDNFLQAAGRGPHKNVGYGEFEVPM